MRAVSGNVSSGRERRTGGRDWIALGFPMLCIEQLFISPGHNFFGHSGQPAGAHPVVAVERAECVAGRGLRGDRFFDYKHDYKGQITFFSMEVFDALRRELNLPDAQPQATRRNAFLRGADLNTLIGVTFEVPRRAADGGS